MPRRRKPSREDKIQQWLELAAIQLGIGDWRIRYVPAECDNCDDGGILACVHPEECYRAAEIRLAAHFWDLGPREQRETLVHELCHLFTARLMDAITKVRKELPAPVYSLWRSQINDAEEFAVDAMARALAPALPLPRF